MTQADSLVERYCACRCGKRWRTLPSSPCWFWGEDHAARALTMEGEAEARVLEHFNRPDTPGGRRWGRPAGDRTRTIAAMHEPTCDVEAALTHFDCREAPVPEGEVGSEDVGFEF